MDKKEILSRLLALQKSYTQWHSNIHSYLSYDPNVILNIYERYSRFRDILKTNHADQFDDLPLRDKPTVQIEEFVGGDSALYISEKDFQALTFDINYCIELLSHNTETIPPAITREGVFFSGQYFDALQLATEILNQAQQEIAIIDGYVDASILKMLTFKDQKVNVKILTYDASKNRKLPAFTASAQAFNQQYQGISVRTSNAFHDRFLIIDDKEFFHFGASIKDLGNKGFMFSRIEELQVERMLRNNFQQEWGNAVVVV